MKFQTQQDQKVTVW